MNRRHTLRKSDALRIANGWLGWGDPKRGVWFIGIEEGKTFTPAKIAEMKGRLFQPVVSDRTRNSPVQVRTASIVCSLNGIPATPEYRRSRLGRPGSGVFNGNLYPLGRPSTTTWPATYSRLFGLTAHGYLARSSAMRAYRFQLFRHARATWRPQAIVCFGKSGWADFRELFRLRDEEGRYSSQFDIWAYDAARVIVTPHFSRGSLMPNRAVVHVARILRRWKVHIRG